MSAAPRPAVSVVIPAFNRRHTLPATLAGVRAQTFTDHEVVLIDDGSSDGTSAWVRRAFPEVRVIRFPRNRGPGAARIRAVAAARGRFVAFLDADDVWRPGYLQALIPEFRDPKVVVAFSNINFIDAKGRVTRRRVLRRPRTRWILPLTSASIVRRAALRAAGGIDPVFQRLFEDVDLFARLVARHGASAFRLVDRGLVDYRTHGVQLTSVLNPSISAWVRRSPSAEKDDRVKLLDLAYLDMKQRRGGDAFDLGAKRR